jgi:hypothetical protein
VGRIVLTPPRPATHGGLVTIGQKSSIFAKIFRAANPPITTRFDSGYAGLGTIRPTRFVAACEQLWILKFRENNV